jgi:hypothetical protein
MDEQQLEHHITACLDALHREFNDRVSPSLITSTARKHYQRLDREATINDYLPVFIHRYTREELLHPTSTTQEANGLHLAA